MDGILAIMLRGALLGLAAFFAACMLYAAAVSRRRGRSIPLSGSSGGTVRPVPLRLPGLYAAASVLVMTGASYGCRQPAAEAFLTAELAVLLAASMADMMWRIIPNGCCLALAAVRLLFLCSAPLTGAAPDLKANLLASSAGALAGFALFFLGGTMTGGKVGMGDVKLAAASGFVLGTGGLLTAVALMGVLTLPMAFLQPGVPVRERLRRMVPLGPPLSLAVMLVLTAGFTPLARVLPRL